MTLGEVIKAYRLEHGLSMDVFASMSNLSKGYISMLEKNQNPRTGKPIAPSIDTYNDVARAMNIRTEDLMKLVDKNQPVRIAPSSTSTHTSEAPMVFPVPRGRKIPILGKVVAGIPIEAIEDVLGYIEIDEKMARGGRYFALKVKGGSMEPTLHDGDTIVVRQQETINNGEMAIVLVNGSEATVKEVKESESGITLIGHNVAVYSPHFYSWQEVESLPIQVIEKVVELRRKF